MPQWHAKRTGEYARDSVEAMENGEMFLGYMMFRGFTKEACSAIWGNIGHESVYNPWRWEGDRVLPYGSPLIPSSRTNGYGLPQFTPSGKYLLSSHAQANADYAPNYSDRAGQPEDAVAQLDFLIWSCTPGSGFPGGPDYFINPNYNYPLTFAEFTASTLSPEYLAAAWLHNYERPGDQSASVERLRGATARYWYDLWGGIVPPVPTSGSKYKFWLYGRNWTRRQRRF